MKKLAALMSAGGVCRRVSFCEGRVRAGREERTVIGVVLAGCDLASVFEEMRRVGGWRGTATRVGACRGLEASAERSCDHGCTGRRWQEARASEGRGEVEVGRRASDGSSSFNRSTRLSSTHTSTMSSNSLARTALRYQVRRYAVPSFAPSSASPFAVFDRDLKRNQRDRAARHPERSRLTDYVKDDVAQAMVDRLLVRHLSLSLPAPPRSPAALHIAAPPSLADPTFSPTCRTSSGGTLSSSTSARARASSQSTSTRKSPRRSSWSMARVRPTLSSHSPRR